MMNIYYILFPYFLFHFIHTLYGTIALGIFRCFIGLFVQLFMAYVLIGIKNHKKIYVIGNVISIILFGVYFGLYHNRTEVKYAGHGFNYMHGYSSTDFSEYHVYSNPSKLVSLDHPSSLMITDNYPVLDGAEACYPLYSAIAKETYASIGEIEYQLIQSDYQYTNGKYVSFTNSVRGFQRLVDGEVDILFGARPSKEQILFAEEQGVELEIIPIGKEGFVFFVEESNPIETLTIDQIQSIYHGDIENWKQLNGIDQSIIAFQRPEGSGSQSMMEYVMGDIPLKEPMTYEKVSSMEGIIQNVAQYHNESGAIGYTFRYFLEELHQEENVKILAINGIYPTRENISNGSYPFTVDLCIIKNKNHQQENVESLIDFILSDDGQTLIYETGYSKLED